MGFLEWLGISPRDKPGLPEIVDNVRDSGQTFVFGRADSGERVDEKSAMQIATVYACVRLLAETVAGLPLHLYRYTDKEGKEKEMAKDHPLYKILYRQPNPEMTSFSFRETMLVQLLLWGKLLCTNHPRWQERDHKPVPAPSRKYGDRSGREW